MMSSETISSEMQPEAALVELFQRNGYMRVPNDDRREEEPRNYKKGYEIRLVANTQRAITAIRRLLRQAGLKSGKPFKKKAWFKNGDRHLAEMRFRRVCGRLARSQSPFLNHAQNGCAIITRVM